LKQTYVEHFRTTLALLKTQKDIQCRMPANNFGFLACAVTAIITVQWSLNYDPENKSTCLC